MIKNIDFDGIMLDNDISKIILKYPYFALNLRREDMNPDWEKLGRDVQHIVEDAVNSQNFSQLNKTITNAVNDTVANVRENIRTAQEANKEWSRKSYRWYGQKADSYRAYGTPNMNYKPNTSDITTMQPSNQRKAELSSPSFFNRNTGVKAGGWAMTICGCVLNAGLGLAVIILCLVSLLLGEFSMGTRIALSILLPFLVCSAILTGAGSRMLSAIKRYRIYIEGLKGRTYCNIKELADLSGKSVSYVVRDVKKMISKGWFLQGHLDEDDTCLIVSHETYREYEEIKKQRAEHQKAEQYKNKEETEKAGKTAQNEALAKVMEKGQEYISKIRACNDAIPGEEISGKISHMEMIIQRIFDRVREDPESLEDIDKMMEYYLPTTVKLLEAYQRLDGQPVQGENIMTPKQEIEKTLDTLNKAFEKLLDSLFEDVAWDVSSDISVLHTMLAQEGLTGNEDFKH